VIIQYALADVYMSIRQCCGANRAFDMKIFDNAQQEVIHLERPLRCDSCWYPCCLQEVRMIIHFSNHILSLDWTARLVITLLSQTFIMFHFLFQKFLRH